MGTIAQEITRIQGAKSDLATSITNKGVTVPAATKIDGYAALVDQIQQGGSVPFLEETDLSYMFDYRQSSDDKIIDGINRFKNNDITNLYRTFYYFNDNRYVSKPNEENLFFELIKYYITHFPNANKREMCSYLKINDWSTSNVRNAILDLRGMKLVGSDCYNFFNNIGSNTQNVSTLTFIIDKDFFKDVACYGSFSRAMRNITIKLIDRKLIFTKDCSDLFYYFDGSFVDENDNRLTEATFEFNFSTKLSLSDFMDLNTTQTSSSIPLLERVHLIINNGNNVSSYGNAFANCFWLKSIDGIDFSGLSSSTGAGNLFNTSGNKYYDNFGELGIVNGSTLGRYNNLNLILKRIWANTADTIIDGQTIGYWYEKFANALGNKAATGTQTITINTTLYNSLTQTQKELITNKGYTLAYAS